MTTGATRSRMTLMPKLSPAQQETFLKTLEDRFEKHMERHKGVSWETVRKKVESNAGALVTLWKMEETGGEPDVVILDKKSKDVVFVDCAAQSPKGRRSCCYDRAARVTRKEHPPKTSALEMAKDLGIAILDEQQYRALQECGEFDTTTSSWIDTPQAVRKHGGGLFCDRRYQHVFTYHNGADSYYAARGFRGMLRV